MSLSRRQMIEAGASAGALAVLGSSPLLASVLQTPGVRRRPDMQAEPCRALQPARPAHHRRSQRGPAACDPRPRRLRSPSLAHHPAGSGRHRRFHQGLQRAALLSARHQYRPGHAPFRRRTAAAPIRRHTGFLQNFSNRIGSEATSEGAYLVGPYYEGHYGRSMRVSGLDHTNFNAEARAIVIHPAWYAEPSRDPAQGRLGRSEGCFALSASSQRETLARLGPGHFLYAARA